MTNRVSDLLESLATCLCAQISADGSPETCFCGVIPGTVADASYMGDCASKCGMAWVRMSAIYPATTVGQLDESSQNCGALLGIDIEVGMMRCVEIGSDDGSPPTPASLLEDSHQQHIDAMTMWRAVACCGDLTSKDYRLGPYVPIGPDGGYMGGAWTVSVML